MKCSKNCAVKTASNVKREAMQAFKMGDRKGDQGTVDSKNHQFDARRALSCKDAGPVRYSAGSVRRCLRFQAR